MKRKWKSFEEWILAVRRRMTLIFGPWLGALILAALTEGCTRNEHCEGNPCMDITVTVSLGCNCFLSKTSDPDENAIWNVNVFVFNEYDMPVGNSFVRRDNASDSMNVSFRLLKGCRYRLFAIANAGFRMPEYSASRLCSLRYFLAYPDDYLHGMPMSAYAEFEAEDNVEVYFERMMSKVSLCLDRSMLDDDVQLYVEKVSIGNTPQSIFPFCAVNGQNCSYVRDRDDVFATGFAKTGVEVSRLNERYKSGKSDYINLYMLENAQDTLFDEDLCSYVEIAGDYSSDRYYCEDGNTLKYRFLLREKHGCRVERNNRYSIVVRPAGDGLQETDNWRIDKSALVEWEGTDSLKIIPGGSWIDGRYYSHYYEMERGSSMHFDFTVFPKYVQISLREDLVEEEYEEGRAEYLPDDDGMGMTVVSLGRACRTMMEIIPGPPLGSAYSETVVIECI